MSELVIRPAREEDSPALRGLWAGVFGDGEELIGAFFRLLWRPEDCAVAECGGQLVSMGFCLPGAAALGLRCSYIYAMATSAPFRGRGAAREVGRRLISRAFASGADVDRKSTRLNSSHRIASRMPSSA